MRTASSSASGANASRTANAKNANAENTNTNTNAPAKTVVANAPAKTLADFVATLHFATKRNGGKNGNGNTATLCRNPDTPRLTLPRVYRERGYLSGLTGVDDDGTIFVVLSKQRYTDAFTAFHPTQHFVTVLGSVAEQLRALSYTFTVSERDAETDGDTLVLELTPNGDAKN